MQSLRIYENLRTLSYAPFYVALEKNFYASHGLNVEMVHSPAPAETALGLIEGRVDVSFGGPMRVTMHHDEDPNCPLVCFCQVVGPDPFVLIGKQPKDSFQFTDLLGLTVAVVSEVPTPWLTLQDDLRRAGVAPEAITQAPPRSMADNVEALRHGEVDVIQVMEPHTSTALAHDGTHLWHRFSTRGNIGFTTYYTTRSYAQNHRDACLQLSQATSASIEWLYATDALEIAQLLLPRFGDVGLAILRDGIARYQDAHIWTLAPSVQAHEFVKLKGALLSGGLISTDVPFTHVIDNSLAVSTPHPAGANQE